MAKTIFNNVSSQGILSAHINGLAHSINNLETVLDMKTKSVQDAPMVAINDMDELELHNRIYECSTRGFIADVVVKRNGTQVQSSEFEIQPSFGVVVFHQKQSDGTMITISGTCISSESTKLETVDTDITTLKTKVEKLESTGGGGGGETTPPETVDIAIDGYMAGGGNLVDGKLIVPKGDVWITHTLSSSPAPSSAVAVGSNTIDAFPIYVSERVVIDKMKIVCAKVNQQGAKGILAIYSCANGLPHRRLAQTSTFNDVVGTIELPFREGKDLRLEEGIYWVARFCNAGTQYDGIASTNAIPVTFPSDMTVNGSGVAHGIRGTHGNSETLPLEFPLANSTGLARTSYTCPYLHIKKTYV